MVNEVPPANAVPSDWVPFGVPSVFHRTGSLYPNPPSLLKTVAERKYNVLPTAVTSIGSVLDLAIAKLTGLLGIKVRIEADGASRASRRSRVGRNVRMVDLKVAGVTHGPPDLAPGAADS